MKNVTAVYFSPTQGSKKYTEAIAKVMGAEDGFDVVDLTAPAAREKEYTFGAEDVVIFGAPVYAGRLPFIPGEEEIFSHIKASGGAKAVFTVTYGNREFDDALLEMSDILEDAGFTGVAAAAWLAQHTYTNKLAGGRPDEEDLMDAEGFGQRVKEMLEEGGLGKLEIPGNRPYKERKHLPMNTEATEKCGGCGHCADVCPTDAIDREHGFAADKEKCIGCLACEKTCPSDARVVNDPGLAAIRAKLEPAFGGVHKEPKMFFAEEEA